MNVPDEITHCLMDFKCIDPTPQMFRLQIYTNFALDLQLRQQDPKSQVYTFMKLPFTWLGMPGGGE